MPTSQATAHHRDRPARRRPLGPVLLGLLVMLGFTFCGISSADVWCNEALAHLLACCPELDATRYSCEGPQFPVGCEHYSFDVETGKRIALASCPQLVAAGDCSNPPLPRVAPVEL